MKPHFRQFFLLFALVFSIHIQAQFVCTDVNPDMVASGNSTVDIDLNNDATVDFRVTSASVTGAGFVILQAGQVGTNNFVLTNGSGSVSCLPLNSPISSTSTSWTQMNATNQQMMSVFSGVGSGPWSGATDQYLGLQFAVGTNTYYGWAKFSFSNASNTYTLKEYGYNSSAGQPILAGQGCGIATFTFPTTACVGQTINLAGNISSSSFWISLWSLSGGSFLGQNPPGVDVKFSSPGIYTATMLVTNGTITSAVINSLTVIATPTISLSPNSGTFCPNAPVTVMVTGVSSYTWAPTNGLNLSSPPFVIASPNSSTVYTVTGSNGSCTATSTIAIAVGNNPTVSVVSAGHGPLSNGSSISVCEGTDFALSASGAPSYTWLAFSTPPFSSTLSNITTSHSGGFVLKGENIDGCGDSLFFILTVHPKPTLTLTSSSPTTCITGNFPKVARTLSLTGTGANNYVIFPYSILNTQTSPGNFEVKWPSSVCYTVVGFSSFGCTDTSFVCTTVISQPTISVSPASASICPGNSVQLLVSNPVPGMTAPHTYSWLEGIGAIGSLSSYTSKTVSASPGSNVTYSVSAVDSNSCISEQSTVTVTLLNCTGLMEDDPESANILVYPNPSQDKIVVGTESGLKINTILVMDISGRLVKVEIPENNTNTIHVIGVEDLPKGIYFIRLDFCQGHSAAIKKIIKE